ncbi:carboxy terminal-processing peptidase [Cytophagales bacterium LB-30]|uniref:Carboxy terminal-processing peptidase n=1 Tax=Shiella aurantiaca TaxID=3058365 RepID=A0ABT8F797_9BACT|nr:carboxy terminal-processing peptidase [Shiella aurantiaca]MDN4165831.1 carboxy terminal-processing peptidase [Shiella aurantiaca]
MKRIVFFLLPFVVLASFLPSYVSNGENRELADTAKVIMPSDDQLKSQMVITGLITNYHYRKIPLADSLSSVILDTYIESLDYNKLYFLASDIKSFEKYRYSLDEDLKKGNLVPAYHIFNVFKKNFLTRQVFIKELLKTPFDFTADEYYEADREKASWATTEAELDEEWRKMLKSQAISLMLSGKDWEGTAKILNERYDRLNKAIVQYNSEDVFSMYMNAFAESYDPHTSYLSPAASDNFKIDMSRELEGIGATLRTDNDFTRVAEIVPGGPAFKSKQIYKDDRIIAVAQGDNGEFVDVIGWRLDEVVKLIRGPKGTVVRLQILEASAGANAMPKEIRIVRDKVKLEEQSAKKEVIDIQQNGKNYRLGVISVPAFYINFEDAQKGVKDYKSTTNDVRKLINELKAENIQGLVIDLRYNGGGSLLEAIDMTGLFIEQGPVVQVKNSDGSIDVGDDKNTEIAYDGPLAVLTNRFSASASEIFAGAIQDYERGVIIGEQTYGKGTVQNLIDLQRFIPDAKSDLGQVKLTLAKYYRITGGSTQHKGVSPDIAFPSVFSASEYGESSQPSALPYDEIRPTRFTSFDKIDAKVIQNLQKSYSSRMANDPEMKRLIRDIEEAKKADSETLISLQMAKREKQKEEAERRRENMEKLSGGSIDTETGEDTSEPVKKADDPYLKEGLYILADLIELVG